MLAPVDSLDLYVQALHDFVPDPSSPGSNTCLPLRSGQIVRVLNHDASGWWDGELSNQRGWFPSNYVVALPSHSDRTRQPASERRQVSRHPAWHWRKVLTDRIGQRRAAQSHSRSHVSHTFNICCCELNHTADLASTPTRSRSRLSCAQFASYIAPPKRIALLTFSRPLRA